MPATLSEDDVSILNSRLRERNVAILGINFGPYHLARFRAVARALGNVDAKLAAIELSRRQQAYPWRVVVEEEPFAWRSLFEDRTVEQADSRAQRRAVCEALDAFEPAAVVIPGWSHVFLRAAAGWCRRNRVPSICHSNSTASTRRRNGRVIGRPWYLEAYKRWLLRRFDAVQAAGVASRDYFRSLGVPEQRIFMKLNVVDNDYFTQIAGQVRGDMSAMRAKYELPERFFFYPSRLLDLKNHLRLIDAYAQYVERAEGEPWHLLLVGSGPLQEQVDARIEALGLSTLERRDYAQVEDLARYYALASALVFPSTTETWGNIVNEAASAGLPLLISDRCPVTEHLVVDGRNGWLLDPYDVDMMADRMLRVASMPDAAREAMGAASLELVSGFSVDDHANELLRALAAGLRQRGHA